MNNIKEEMRKIIEAMEGIDEALVPEDWQLQQVYRVTEQRMNMFMANVKKLNRMINDFQGEEDLKTHWHYSIVALQDELEDFFKHLD